MASARSARGPSELRLTESNEDENTVRNSDQIWQLVDNHLYLSQIKSGHTGDAIRRGLGGKEYALPSQQYAIGAHP